MRKTKTMKGIAAAALAVALVAAPASECLSPLCSTGFGIMASAAETEAGNSDIQSKIASAQNGDIIKLTENVTTYILVNNKDLTIDLNGHKLVGDDTYYYAAMVYGTSNVTFKNGTAEAIVDVSDSASVTIECDIDVSRLKGTSFDTSYGVSAMNAVQISDNASATVKSGSIKGQIYPKGNSTLNIEGGTVTAIGGFAVVTNGSYSKGSKVNISGGKIDGVSETAVYNPAGTLNISGSAEITGATGVFVRGGTVNVTGGTITATGAKTEGNPKYAPSHDGAAANGDAIVIAATGDGYANSDGTKVPAVTVSGGNITSTNGNAVGTYLADGITDTSVTEPVKNFVEGGILQDGAEADSEASTNSYSTSASQIKVTDSTGKTTTVLGTENAIDSYIENNAADIKEVEVVANVQSVVVPEGVSVENNSNAPVDVNGVEVSKDGDTFEPFKHDAVAADCENPAKKAYYTNGENGTTKYLYDEANKKYTEVTADSDLNDGAALGHDYKAENVTYSWTGYTACTATVTCANDPTHVITENGTITSEVTKEAAEEAEGEKKYTAAFPQTDFAFAADTKTEAIAKLPSTSAGKAAAGKAAVETALDGLTKDNSLTEEAVKTAITNALTGTGAAVDGTPEISIVKATETADGSVSVKLTVAAGNGSNRATESVDKSYTIAKLTPAVTYTEVPAKAATCTDDGNILYYTAGTGADMKYFTKSGDTYTETTLAAVTVKALGHNYVNGVCTRCGAKEYPVVTDKDEQALKSAAEFIENGVWNDEETKKLIKMDKLDESLDTVKDILAKVLEAADETKGVVITDIKYTVADKEAGKVKYDLTLKSGEKTAEASVTLTAGAEEEPPAPPAPAVIYYAVSFTGDYAGSGVTVTGSRAAGAAMTLNVPVGYSATVISGGSRIAYVSDGTGTFTMPAANVTVKVESYLGMLSTGYKNAYIYSYDKDMNYIKTNSVRGGMTSPEGEVTVKLGSDYAGRSVTLYNGRKNTSSKVDEATLNSNGEVTFSVKSGKNYTLVVD